MNAKHFIPVMASAIMLSLVSIAFCAPFAYVANYYSNNVSVIDLGTASEVATIPAGLGPMDVAVSPDGRKVYVTNWTSADITVIDAFARTVATTLPIGASSAGVVTSPDGNTLYVVNRSLGRISAVDPHTGSVKQEMYATFPYDLAISPDGGRLYVTRSMFSTSVDVISTETGTTLTTIKVGRSPQGIAFTTDGKFVYVANKGSNTLSVIDAARNATVATIPVGSGPQGVAVSRSGDYVYVANRTSSTVSVVDTAKNTVVATIGTGVNPQELALDPSGRFLLVTNWATNNVSLIDTASRELVKDIPVQAGPGGIAVGAADTTPPEITVAVDRSTLWPPNHKMTDVMFSVTVADDQDPNPLVKLVSITMNEPCTVENPGKGKGAGSGYACSDDYAGADFGTDDRSISLRAERLGTSSAGRVYTVTYSATDASGNTSYASVNVSVPHDMASN